jgi:hypothetical protein
MPDITRKVQESENMTWEVYRLVYKAMSPVHIGWHTLGYIQRTRPYITGRTMWGAFTANLVRGGFSDSGYNDYKPVGNLLKSGLGISYFYPAVNPDEPMLPRFTAKGVQYGRYDGNTFEKMCIRSFGQTAVIPETNTAEDQSLHESEFISPLAEMGDSAEPSQLYFVGYVWIKADAAYKEEPVKWSELSESLQAVGVGGDRK